MSDDDDETRMPTVRPPPGDEDIYSAETRVGEISPEVAAILKEARAADESRINATDQPSQPSTVQAPPAPEPKAAVPITVASAGGISPALSITFLFAITAVVLAVLAR
ncbi:MAG: hypothetical protein FWD73_07150 [Polyangiaceae bacterium]|nr:hypothetical protein [Polyangiaceae bacterium]